MRYCMWSALRAPASCLAQGQAQFELNYSTVDGGSADLLFTARKAGMPVGEYLTTDVAGTIDDGQYWLDNTLYLPPPSTDLFQPRYLDTSGFLLFTQNGEYNVRASPTSRSGRARSSNCLHPMEAPTETRAIFFASSWVRPRRLPPSPPPPGSGWPVSPHARHRPRLRSSREPCLGSKLGTGDIGKAPGTPPPYSSPEAASGLGGAVSRRSQHRRLARRRAPGGRVGPMPLCAGRANARCAV